MNARTAFVRSVLILILPFILGWAFFAELFRGIKNAFQYAWLEVRIEYDSFRKLLREAGQ
jgi:hypothetical protein